MDKKFLWPILAAVILGLVVILYPRRAPEPPVPLELPAPAPAVAPETEPFFGPDPDPEPPPGFTEQDAPEPPPPLPQLDESDAEARAALSEAAGAELVERHVISDASIRKLVATVDNLSRDGLWIDSRLVPPAEGRLLVEGPEDEPVLAAANALRYAAFARLVGEADVQALARSYQRHYPLLQQAYEELGYPGRQFHNRALEVIDHLLATPQVEGPVRLEQPHVLYRYADPELEALSSGQKILLRVGPENASILRTKLIELRAALEELSATPDAD
jgi:hypothetical protein